jgi:hypothetical protein
MATMIRARIYTSGEVSFAKFLFFAKLVCQIIGDNFSCFAKIRWMPSSFNKLLELLSIFKFAMLNLRAYHHR